MSPFLQSKECVTPRLSFEEFHEKLRPFVRKIRDKFKEKSLYISGVHPLKPDAIIAYEIHKIFEDEGMSVPMLEVPKEDCLIVGGLLSESQREFTLWTKALHNKIHTAVLIKDINAHLDEDDDSPYLKNLSLVNTKETVLLPYSKIEHLSFNSALERVLQHEEVYKDKEQVRVLIKNQHLINDYISDILTGKEVKDYRKRKSFTGNIDKIVFTYEGQIKDTVSLCSLIPEKEKKEIKSTYAAPHGGTLIGHIASQELHVPQVTVPNKDSANFDDLTDSGRSIVKTERETGCTRHYVIAEKPHSVASVTSLYKYTEDKWINLPQEATEITNGIDDSLYLLIEGAGFDPTRENLQKLSTLVPSFIAFLATNK